MAKAAIASSEKVSPHSVTVTARRKVVERLKDGYLNAKSEENGAREGANRRSGGDGLRMAVARNLGTVTQGESGQGGQKGTEMNCEWLLRTWKLSDRIT